ncbi:hypothetical protein XENOCAPTIV_021293, partial [Xenoophorus captivus]
NYSPRQRKLRNLIVQEVDGRPAGSEDTKSAQTTKSNTELAVGQEATNPDSSPGIGPGCIVRVVVESRDAGMEEVRSNQERKRSEGVESFTVPEEQQETQ